MKREDVKSLALIAAGGYIVYQIVQKFKKRNHDSKEIEKKRMIDLIGNTPLIYLESLSKLTNCEIYAKCEFLNPGGSIKDRTCKQIILDAIEKGKLSDSQRKIYEGTSGSTGISLAQLGNSLGFKTKIFLPDDLAQEKILETMGAKLVKVRPCSIVDNQNYSRLAASETQKDDAFYSDQFENLSNYKAHLTQTGPEILEQTKGKVDIFVSGSGTGGTISGVSKFLKSKKPNVKIVLADPQGSSLRNKVNFGICFTDEEAEGYRLKHPFDTVTEGIGLNRLTANFNAAQIDKAYLVTDNEAIQMAHFLIQKEGLFLGSSSAVNACAVVKAAREFGPNHTIVTIFCDSGMRYLSKFYNNEYLQKAGRTTSVQQQSEEESSESQSNELNVEFVK